MIMILFLMCGLTFSSGFYISSYRYDIIDSAFDVMNYTLPNLWLVDIAEKPEHPFYDVKKVEETSISHFNNNLTGILKSYKITFYYFDAKTLQEEIDKDYVTGVRIALSAQVDLFITYNKASTYVINL